MSLVSFLSGHSVLRKTITEAPKIGDLAAEIPCHAQSVERMVKLTTDSVDTVIGYERQLASAFMIHQAEFFILKSDWRLRMKRLISVKQEISYLRVIAYQKIIRVFGFLLWAIILLIF